MHISTSPDRDFHKAKLCPRVQLPSFLLLCWGADALDAHAHTDQVLLQLAALMLLLTGTCLSTPP
jgi:hypothetical protein